MDWLFDSSWVWFALPLLINLGVNTYEKNALARGRDQLDRTVVFRGILTDQGGEFALRPNTWGQVVRGVLRNDLRGVGPWILWLFVAVNLVLGVYSDNLGLLVLAVGALLLYGWMLARLVRTLVTSEQPPTFDADLVELAPPSFLGLASAQARLATGEVFKTHVRWRPTKALSNRGPVVLVFLGQPDEPTKGHFAGYRTD